MQKSERQAHIRRLIEAQAIERQSDFVTQLAAMGIFVTQATISRDIKELQLVKLPMANGRYRYSLPPQKQLAPKDKLHRNLVAAYQKGAVLDRFVHLVTTPGTAPAIGHLLDQLEDERIFATIADDAALLIICQDAPAAQAVLTMIETMTG